MRLPRRQLPDSKSGILTGVRVRVPSSVLYEQRAEEAHILLSSCFRLRVRVVRVTSGMNKIAPQMTHKRPTVKYDGREYALTLEPQGWRLRSRSKSRPLNFRTGTTNLRDAQARAREWLEQRAANPIVSRRGGGTLAALAAVYLATPKRTKQSVAEDNVSRLRTVCRLALNRELDAVTCREVGPELWTKYQTAALAISGYPLDYATRRRENIAINACVRAARCLFLPAMIRAYREAQLDVRADAGIAQTLPQPYLPPSKVDDAALVAAWRETSGALWLTIGLARFAGLRREEISALQGDWIEERDGVVSIFLCDRPAQNWFTKTGKPYRAQVIEPTLSEWLRVSAKQPGYVVPCAGERDQWFRYVPQEWLRPFIPSGKPLHRLRGLYADHIAQLTQDAVTARLAAIRAAQTNLGHTTSATTERHYLTPDALR